AGEIVRTVVQRREMNCLLVTESELRQLSFMNGLVTVFISAGSFILSYPLSIYLDILLQSPTTAVAEVLRQYVCPALIAVSGIFFLLGLFTYVKRWFML